MNGRSIVSSLFILITLSGCNSESSENSDGQTSSKESASPDLQNGKTINANSLFNVLPRSPSSISNPMIKGSFSGAQRVKFYFDSTCSESVAEGDLLTLSTGVALSVPQNRETEIYAKFIDIEGNSSECLYVDSYVHDNLPPILSIMSPSAQTEIFRYNQRNFTISGTCSEEASSIEIKGSASSQTVCNNYLSWSSVLDLSGLPTGSSAFLSASQKDLAGNTTTTKSVEFVKAKTSSFSLSSDTPLANGYFGHQLAVSKNIAIIADSDSIYFSRFVAGSWFIEQKEPRPSAPSFSKFGSQIEIDGEKECAVAFGSAINFTTTHNKQTESAIIYCYESLNGKFAWQKIGTIQNQIASANATESTRIEAMAISGDTVYLVTSNIVPPHVDSKGFYVYFTKSSTQLNILTRKVTGWELVESIPLQGPDDVNDQIRMTLDPSMNWMAISGTSEGAYLGQIMLFSKENNRWTLRQKLTAPDGSNCTSLGDSLAMNNGRLLVGCTRNHTKGTWAGSAYLFEVKNGSWELANSFLPENGYDYFGSAVALSGDVAAISSRGASGTKGGAYPGRVSLFERVGRDWNLYGKLEEGNDRDFFGYVMKYSGPHLLIGMYSNYYSGSSANSPGIVRAYRNP